MQLTIKTLKGEKFIVNADFSHTVEELKSIIESEKTDLPASMMKLIYSGKVLKDIDTLQTCNIKSNAFLVVMITKERKKNSSSEKIKDSVSAPTEIPPLPIPLSSTNSLASSGSKSSISASNSTSVSSKTLETLPSEIVLNLTGMGFPKSEVIACLRASQGNADVAVEFLMNGIPPAVNSTQQILSSSNSNLPPSNSTPLQSFRNHPQINQLRRLVQTNPQTLQAVLTQIGRQQPDLLQEINGNQATFLQIMNQPFQEDSSANPTSSSDLQSAPLTAQNHPVSNGIRPEMMMALSNPGQMSEMIQNISSTELQGMANMMGLTPEQLTATAHMISQMPPQQFQEYMNMAMQRSDIVSHPVGMGNSTGNGVGNDGIFRPQLLKMNEEEISAVDRLTDMGFDRTEVVQAYLACDKNEALAANLLMDGGFDLRNDDIINRSGSNLNNTNNGGSTQD